MHLLRNKLYDLESDIAEQHDVGHEHPDIVKELWKLADECRQDLGDAHTGVEGRNCRPVGRVDNPKTLTSMEQLDPYVRALYDLDDL